MQVNDDLISKLRMFRKGVIESDCVDSIKMPVYSIPISHACIDPIFQMKGYYKSHNGKVKEGEKNTADFCVLECEICHNEFYLMNTGIQNWDTFPNKSKEKVNTRNNV